MKVNESFVRMGMGSGITYTCFSSNSHKGLTNSFILKDIFSLSFLPEGFQINSSSEHIWKIKIDLTFIYLFIVLQGHWSRHCISRGVIMLNTFLIWQFANCSFIYIPLSCSHQGRCFWNLKQKRFKTLRENEVGQRFCLEGKPKASLKTPAGSQSEKMQLRLFLFIIIKVTTVPQRWSVNYLCIQLRTSCTADSTFTNDPFSK